MSDFIESEHPRVRGKFTEKRQSAPDVSLLSGRDRLAVQRASEHPGDVAASRPSYWTNRFDAQDALAAHAPEGFTADQRAGFESVTRSDNLGLDPFEHPFAYLIFVLGNNERLARNAKAIYRTASDPERQTRLDEYWEARADRLAALRDLFEELAARE